MSDYGQEDQEPYARRIAPIAYALAPRVAVTGGAFSITLASREDIAALLGCRASLTWALGEIDRLRAAAASGEPDALTRGERAELLAWRAFESANMAAGLTRVADLCLVLRAQLAHSLSKIASGQAGTTSGVVADPSPALPLAGRAAAAPPPISVYSDDKLVRELNRRLVACPKGHAPELLAMWPCWRCAVERAAAEAPDMVAVRREDVLDAARCARGMLMLALEGRLRAAADLKPAAEAPDMVAVRSATWPWVMAFASEMEAKLALNRHKGDRDGWVNDTAESLLERLREEVEELAAAMPMNLTVKQGDLARVIRGECADVANFAMMIADVAGGLRAAAERAADGPR